MALNPEIQCICRKLTSPKSVVEKADYFLRKLNRKTNGSMGAADMLKYLICVDLSYRDLNIKWDVNIATKLGLKSKQYHNTFNKIQNKLNITKNKTISFEQLSKQFRCTHIKLTFDRIYKLYQNKKLNSLPIIQRKYINLATPVHKAAVFYVTAIKKGKMKVDGEKLCNLMRCDYKKFQAICTDVKQICFDAASHPGGVPMQSRKRKRDEMDNDDQFCDGYTTRKDRKHKEWKEKVLKQDLEMRLKRDNKSGGNKNKRRKIMNTSMNNTNKKKAEPTKMFSIFDKAKKKKKANQNKEQEEVKNDNVIELDDNECDEDIDLKENVKEQENVNNSNKNKDRDQNVNKERNVVIEENKNKNMNGKGNKPLNAKEAARMAALRRQEMMMNASNSNTIDSTKQKDTNT